MTTMFRMLGAGAVLALVALGCTADDDAAEEAGTATAGGAAQGSDADVSTAASGSRPDVGCAVDVVETPETALVEGTVESAVGELDLRAVAYAVSRDGELIAAGAVGESLPGEPASEAMHFRVGNVAYAYLGTLLLLMAEEGEVSLDTTVAELLPDLAVPEADRITLEMLIRNTSGLPDHVRTDDFLDAFMEDPFRTYTVDELIAIGTSLPSWYEPGTGWSYSHTGHVILGEALAAAAGQPLEELLAERVIAPMGLTDTTPTREVGVTDPVLHSFTTERDQWEESTNFNPSWQTAPGSVVTSTVCDLVVSAALIGSGDLLTEESYGEFVKPAEASLASQPEQCPPEVCRQQSEDAYYAFGVRVANGWISQAPLFGGAGGVHAYLPDEDVAVAIQATTGPLTGDVGNPAELVLAELADVLTPAHPTTAS
jgi:CubicO group peptidase (beta-lactamase class C family)